MKFIPLAAGAVALLFSMAPERAAADPITITATVPTWTGTVGGVGVNTLTSGGVTQVRWGENIGNGQSGLGFDPANPPSASIPADTTFRLGTLFHYNNAIGGGSAATSTVLNLVTDVLAAVPAGQTFSYRFFIDETPNVAPCAWPSTTPCADRITFQNLTTDASFTVNGMPYTIELIGFSTDGGVSIVPDFISQEGGISEAGLYARITAPTPVPEPGAMLLLGTALLGLGLARRARMI